MRALGIISEYNPFHQGHMHQMTSARKLSGADYVVVVMSGPLTQRGTFARHDKWTRTRMALLGGADLVLELPTRFACAAAPDFARGGVELLSALGPVDCISFGCEPHAIPLLDAAAEAVRREDPMYKTVLREKLDAGRSWPEACASALAASLHEPDAEKLSGPNTILALQYLAYLPENMRAIPVPRRGEGYDSLTLSPLASAAGIRHALEAGETSAALAAVPFPEILEEAEREGRIHTPDALDMVLCYVLRTASEQELRAVLDMDEGLHHRFMAAARQTRDRQKLLEAVKSRRYTHARLSRVTAHLLLGLTKDLAVRHDTPEYVRVLGFRRSARPLLHEIREACALPLVVKAADFDRENGMFKLDLRAQDLWALGCANPSAAVSGADFLNSPVIIP